MLVQSSRFNVIPDRHTATEIDTLKPIVGVAPVNVAVPALSAAESAQLAEITTVNTDLTTYTASALPKLSNIETVTKLIPATL